MAIPDVLCGDAWSKKTARRIFPLLVWCAEHGKKIAYGQLDAELRRRKWGEPMVARVYGHPAGAIGDALLEVERERGEKVPPLNALVVNAETGIPGAGCDYYIKTYLEAKQAEELSDEQRKAMAEETMEEVWRFQNWREILIGCDLEPLEDGIPSLESSVASRKPTRGGWSSEPESEEHRTLKDWVARNPQILKSTIPFRPGSTEWGFASADRADVLFAHEDGCIAVEVKAANANDADLERGIYQCVKYQALLRAELKAETRIPNGTAMLVTERQLPSQLQELAGLLGVRVINVPRIGQIFATRKHSP